MSVGYRDVPRIRAPSARVWREIKQRSRIPHVITGALDTLPALTRWTDAYLLSALRDREIPVEYSVRPISRPDARLNGGRYLRRRMPFEEAFHRITTPPVRGVHHYISSLYISKALPELAGDTCVPPLLAREKHVGSYFFAGPDGSGSPLHYDATDNYVAIIRGAKRVLLLPPGNLRALRVRPLWVPICGLSELPPSRIEQIVAENGGYATTASAGELLYLPQHWWHFVVNEGLTIGVTMLFSGPPLSALRWRNARLELRLGLDRWLHRHKKAAGAYDAVVEKVAWWRSHAKRPIRVSSE